MATNKAVEEQERLAEEIHQKVYGNTDQAPEDQQQQQQEQQPQDVKPSTETAPAEPKEEDSWESRFKVLEGKYRNEVPRYAQEVRELKKQLELAKSEQHVQQPNTVVESHIKPEEVQEYGADFIDLVKRAAAEVVAQNVPFDDIRSVKQKVDSLDAKYDTIGQKTFDQELTEAAPEWKKLNEDQGFLVWLAERDPLSGKSRQDLLDDAVARGDATRTATFFTTYVGGNQSWAKQPEDALQNQVTPSHSRVDAPPPGKKFWTSAEVAKFYDDARRGKYSETEYERIDRDISIAQHEGRFRA